MNIKGKTIQFPENQVIKKSIKRFYTIILMGKSPSGTTIVSNGTVTLYLQLLLHQAGCLIRKVMFLHASPIFASSQI